jgi:hypothetical protein
LFSPIPTLKQRFDIQYRELKLAIKPYKKDWNEWTRSAGCFLEEDEVLTINKFLNTRSDENMPSVIDSDEMLRYITLKNAIAKLTLFLEIFKKYQKIEKAKRSRNKKIRNKKTRL